MKNKDFIDVNIPFPYEILSPQDLNLIKILVPAVKILSEVYFKQVSQNNPQTKLDILKNAPQDLIDYFTFMAGKWDRLDDDKPFWDDEPKPLGAGFYPTDMSKQEFEDWLKKHPKDKQDFHSYFTIIQRKNDALVAIPYAKAYIDDLLHAATLLNQASELVSNRPQLQNFLQARAKALLSNDYVESDKKWIDLNDSTLELTYGPYEVYEDRLFGYKAAFTAYLGIKDPQLSQELEFINSLIPEMEKALPIPEEYKAKQHNFTSNVSVVDLVITGGNAASGVQTLAYVLPNDPNVRKLHGTKKIILRNIQKAKFEHILFPIAKRFMTEEQCKLVNFEAFFRHTLLHETGHSIGPKNTIMGTPIHESLGNLYVTIEEAKADMLALFLNKFLSLRHSIDEEDLHSSYATMLAGFFRSMRFGLSSAHAKANAIQLNFMLEKKAITIENDKFVAHFDKLAATINQLIYLLIKVEANGNPDEAQEFIDKYINIPQLLQDKIQTLRDIPTDIKPHYEVEDWLAQNPN